MFCTNCGKELNAKDRYCAKCGTPVLNNLSIDLKEDNCVNDEAENELVTDEISVCDFKEATSLTLDKETKEYDEEDKSRIYVEMEENTIVQKYFSLHGRLNRKPFILRNLVVLAATILVYFMVSFCIGYLTYNSAISIQAGTVVSLLFCWILQASLQVRRLHDLDISGWGVVIYGIAYVLFDNLPDSTLSIVLKCILSTFIFYLLYFSRGTVGDNKYGIDPLQNKD